MPMQQIVNASSIRRACVQRIRILAIVDEQMLSKLLAMPCQQAACQEYAAGDAATAAAAGASMFNTDAVAAAPVAI